MENTFEPPEGGFRAWLVCITSFWTNGTIFGILNTFGLLFVALKEEFEESGEADLAFKICKSFFPLILLLLDKLLVIHAHSLLITDYTHAESVDIKLKYCVILLNLLVQN